MVRFAHKQAILPALLTPFTADGMINYKALDALIDRLVEEGVDGFYATGSSGEALLMSTEERKQVAAAVLRRVNGRAPVIVQVGSTNPRESFELARHAAENGAAAVSSVPPFYYKYSTDEIKKFYFDLADVSGLPVLVYNVSLYTGVEFNMQNAGDLLTDERILGIKHTNFNLYTLNRFKSSCPDKLVFNGFDECLLGGLAMGADGAIGTTYNAMAPLVIRIRDLYAENRMQEALVMQNLLNDYVDAIIKAGVIGATKYTLTLQGVDAGFCRTPNAPISEEGKRVMEEAVAKINAALK